MDRRDPPRWTFLLVSGLSLALLGAALSRDGLWDPWETHYAEVARQMLVRHDPVSPWWQPGLGPEGTAERHFWSKPVLAFWLMAGALRAFGVGTSPDPGELVLSHMPELAVRLPMVLLAWGTALALGATAGRLAGARAGLATVVVASSLPQFAIIARQALTDMPMVATLTWALCAIALAELDPRASAPLPRIRLRWGTVPRSPAALACALVLVVGAAVPILIIVAHSREKVQMLPYGLALPVVAVAVARARREADLLWIFAHGCLGLSFAAKGLIGPGLAGAVVLAYAVVVGRVGIAARRGFLSVGVLAFACTALPWFHAMIVRHGLRFVNVMFVEHQLTRFATGEQKQAVGDLGFYLRTLAAASFPWGAWVPAAVFAGWPRRTLAGPSPQQALAGFAVLWLVAGLGVLALGSTKYHHYLLPLLPAVALLVGPWLANLPACSRRQRVVWVLSALVLWLFSARDLYENPAALAHLCTYLYTGEWLRAPVGAWWVPAASLGFALATLTVFTPAGARAAAWSLGFGAAIVTAAILHVYLPHAGARWSQRSIQDALYSARGNSSDAPPLIAWRLNYRGETFYTKGQVWVSVKGDKEALVSHLAEREGSRFVLTQRAGLGQLRVVLRDHTISEIAANESIVLLQIDAKR